MGVVLSALQQLAAPIFAWDLGKEMAEPRLFDVARDVRVYFCDPRRTGIGSRIKIATDCSGSISQKSSIFRATGNPS